MITHRLFEEEDIEEIRALIAHTLRTANCADYPEEYIEEEIQRMDDAFLIEKSIYTNFYVFFDGEKIVGTGAIGPYWGKEGTSRLFHIYVLPEFQGKGIGREILKTLEQDRHFLEAKQIDASTPASALGFFKKMGYEFKDDMTEPDDEQLYRLGKYRDDV